MTNTATLCAPTFAFGPVCSNLCRAPCFACEHLSARTSSTLFVSSMQFRFEHVFEIMFVFNLGSCNRLFPVVPNCISLSLSFSRPLCVQQRLCVSNLVVSMASQCVSRTLFFCVICSNSSCSSFQAVFALAYIGFLCYPSLPFAQWHGRSLRLTRSLHILIPPSPYTIYMWARKYRHAPTNFHTYVYMNLCIPMQV